MDKDLKEVDAPVGVYIREYIIPKAMSVKAAAEMLGVGRPALSNLLNGHAALSPDMAARLERTFGTSARELMDIQAAYETKLARQRGVASTTRAHIPPFMKFKAHDIEQWASTIKARTRFAVLLRALINSTGLKINKIDFPGNDDAERPGWDGFLESGEGTPWVPSGLSGWEFGTNEDPKRKADKDYKKSIEQHTLAERAQITFVFVTSRRWSGKTIWQQERLSENNWKDVLVFDASDIEQWMEQSIPAQAWLAGELGVPSQGVMSLDECWKRWTADSEPMLSESLFETVVKNSKSKAKQKLDSEEPLFIESDSIEEALAFLNCLFAPQDPDLSHFRDRIAVFTEPGALSYLAAKPADFIPVITRRDIEREFASYKRDMRSIIIYPRNATNAEIDIPLEPLGQESFRQALESMGCSRDLSDRLSRESGRSLTVLRRRLSKLEAIRKPAWASDMNIAQALSVFMFAGAWDASNESDRTILSLLANDMEYEQLENKITELLLIEETPVWSIGHIRGLVSKLDTLYAINQRLAWADIERFLNIAHLVLSEDDPSLDLPEEQQWAAGIFGKTREISSQLRNGIGETLVLLAVHGNSLFLERLGYDVEIKIGLVIRSLLTPLTLRKLEAQADELPLYAEAAPETFLKIIDEDLRSNEPQSLGLMSPVHSGPFGRNHRSGLLWALESLAWTPKYLLSVTGLLAQLSQPVIKDNWVNKPSESLSAIFRCWMPQTAAPLSDRISALEYLVREYPRIAWPLCVEQFDGHSKIGSYSYKPRWRTDAFDAGDPVTPRERNEFSIRAFELALKWESHTADTLGDLVSCIPYLSEKFQHRVWVLIEEWHHTADEAEKAVLREKIRTSIFTRRVKQVKKHRSDLMIRAQKMRNLLEPTDVILRHEWMFKKPWIEASLDELDDEEFDYKAHTVKVEALRREALTEIMSKCGLEGILKLAGRGDSATTIGWLISDMLVDDREVLKLGTDIIDMGSLEESKVRQSVISGLLHGLVNTGKAGLIRQLIKNRKDLEIVSVLLHAPFVRGIWDIVETLKPESKDRYWSVINPPFTRGEEKDLQYAVNHLLAVNRPGVAFTYAQFDLATLPPQLLFKMVSAISTSSHETAGSYQIDSYHINEAFQILTASGEIPIDQMAGLEFQFIEVFERNGIPNLEKHIENHPELFVQAVAMAYKREDGGEDPEELRSPNQEIQAQRAQAAFHLLRTLSGIPGHNNAGQLDAATIEHWIQTVRRLANELSRGKICDICLGELFANAPVGQDGVWPCEPVRQAIEHVSNDEFSRGLTTGLYNSRGVHSKGEGGDDERNIARKYENWAQALDFSYPRVSAILRDMARSYQLDAVREDNWAGVRRRLLY